MGESREGMHGQQRSVHLSGPPRGRIVSEEDVEKARREAKRFSFMWPFGKRVRPAEGEGEPAGNSGRKDGSVELYEAEKKK